MNASDIPGIIIQQGTAEASNLTYATRSTGSGCTDTDWTCENLYTENATGDIHSALVYSSTTPYVAYEKFDDLYLATRINSKWREAQFETNSRLQSETEPVSEIHFTPGSPRFLKASVTLQF